MPLNFAGIIKKRVPFVPYVRPDENADKSNIGRTLDTGHTPTPALSTMSMPEPAGQNGQVRTCITLQDMRLLSNCFHLQKQFCGHAGHTGHVISDDDAEFFHERAAVAEFDGGLSRADAEAQAFAEWQGRQKIILH